jgi:phosphate/sulfate permease
LCRALAFVFLSLVALPGVGGIVGAFGGMIRAVIATPSVLERSMIVGVEAAKKEMPQVSKMVASNALLLSSVGFAYAGGKCLSESLYGEPHPLNAG